MARIRCIRCEIVFKLFSCALNFLNLKNFFKKQKQFDRILIHNNTLQLPNLETYKLCVYHQLAQFNIYVVLILL